MIKKLNFTILLLFFGLQGNENLQRFLVYTHSLALLAISATCCTSQGLLTTLTDAVQKNEKRVYTNPFFLLSLTATFSTGVLLYNYHRHNVSDLSMVLGSCQLAAFCLFSAGGQILLQCKKLKEFQESSSQTACNF